MSPPSSDAPSPRSQLRTLDVRTDRDITDFERFLKDFEGSDPRFAHEADFYGDEVQMLWTSISSYLRILEALAFPSHWSVLKKIQVLNELYLVGDYPRMTEGIDRFLSGLHLMARK